MLENNVTRIIMIAVAIIILAGIIGAIVTVAGASDGGSSWVDYFGWLDLTNSSANI